MNSPIETLRRKRKMRLIMLPVFMIISIALIYYVKIAGFSKIEPFIIPIVLFYWIYGIILLNLFNISLSPFKFLSSPGKSFEEVDNEKDALTDEFIQIVGSAIKEEKRTKH